MNTRSADKQPEKLEDVAGGSSDDAKPSISSTPASLMPGFTNEQANSLSAMIHAVINTTMQEFAKTIPAIVNTVLDKRGSGAPTPKDDRSTTPLVLESKSSSTYRLRAEEIGFFNPEYIHDSPEPIVDIGKHVMYRDVYIFMDRLEDVTIQYPAVVNVIPTCFRGSAIMWFSNELTNEEKNKLRRSRDTQLWYTSMIKRFKMRRDVAVAHLTHARFTYADLQHTTPRAWIQNLLHIARAAELSDRPEHELYKMVTIYNAIDIDMRQNIPNPDIDKVTFGRFLECIDAVSPIWYEIAEAMFARQQQPQQHQGQQQQNPRQRPLFGLFGGAQNYRKPTARFASADAS